MEVNFGIGLVMIPVVLFIFMLPIALLVVLMIPYTLLIVPDYEIVAKMGLLNSFWSLIIPYISGQQIFGIILAESFYREMPGDLFEAAKIDGANYVQTLKNIIIPLVMTSITTCTFLALTDCFKMYDQNLALTGGAPADQTTMLAMDIYNTYYNRTGFAGVGQAKAVVFTVLVLVIALIQLRATQSKEAA